MAAPSVAETHAPSIDRRDDDVLEVMGEGRDLLLLPALSSISTRHEMRPLAERLAPKFRCLVPDWPGFGDRPRATIPLQPETLHSFLVDFIASHVRTPAVGIAAGHAAPYLLAAARQAPGVFERLVLIAPTWRGPLPTAMGDHRRSRYDVLRKAVEAPVIGPLLYRLNVSRFVVTKMMRAHVYADPARVTDAVLDAKMSVTRQPRARFGTAAFVTGGLDLVRTRQAFLDLLPVDPMPILLIKPLNAPARSSAEMEALAETGRVTVAMVPGALAAYEEYPDEVAAAILSFLTRSAP